MKQLLAFLLSMVAAPVFAQTLVAIPTHPTPGIQLSWTAGGAATVSRWTDANSTPVTIGSGAGSFLDSTAIPNTIYYYSVAGQNNVAIGVISDLTLPFNCPPMVPVDPSKLGVDRTETFQGADGKIVSFTIQAPVTSSIINVPPCNGAGGCSDYTNVNAALASNGTLVQLSAGDYHFNNPAWAPGFNFNIFLSGTDTILAGAAVASGAEPTTRLFFNQGGPSTANQVVGLTMTGNRHLVRNVSIDWDFPTALPGIVTDVDSTHQKFTVNNGAYYIPDPANPPVLAIPLDAYYLTNKSYNQQTGARASGLSVFNPNFSVDGLYYYTINGKVLPNNTEAVAFVQTRIAINDGSFALNTSLENIRIYGGGGPGVIQGGSSQGLRMSNVVIERKPDALLSPGEQPRYVSLVGDNDSNASLGSVLIENSQFGYIEDDTYYARGASFQLQTLSSTSGFVMNTASLVINHSPGANDIFVFQDPATYKQIGSPVLATWTHVGSVWTFSFPAVPELAAYVGASAGNLPIVGEPLWSSPNVVVRNVCSHDNHGHIGFLQSNGLVENSVLANSYFGSVLYGINVNAIPGGLAIGNDGPGATNHIWRNNKIIGVGYGRTDLQTIWAPTVVSNNYLQTGQLTAALGTGGVTNTGFYPPGYTNANFQIYNNFISNTPGLCISIVGANNVGVVGNICVDANAIPNEPTFTTTLCGGHSCCGAFSQGVQPAGANQPWCLDKIPAQGAIMITNSRNVDATSTPNVFLGTSSGLFVDTPTVSTDNIIGSRFIH